MTGAAAAGDDGRTRYTIDVRLFLVAITAAMAMSFGAGVAFGPSPSSMTLSLTDLSLPAQGSATPVQQHRRLPTTHSAELGKKISESHVNFETPVLENMGDGAVYHPKNESGDDADDEEHLPAGQHLLVDIKNIEAAFLNSESRLAQAMVDVVKAGGLTLLSYHCHSLLPAGVSCVGVLLESHISFHTWPDEGVITLDLFTCGSSPLLPVVPVIEELFGIPRSPDEKVITLWAHELRGFRHQEMRKSHYLDDQSDLAYYVTSPLDMHVKRQIVSTKSPYQQIDIWDVMDIDDTPTYEDGLLHNLTEGDPRWLTNEVASPERLLFLDGTLQSMSESEKEYHEALVHPAMFAHPNPKKVAIVGGGEGATLREVLKHTTVEKATMIEIDEMMVEIAREHLPKMSDCSNYVGRADSCFDDAVSKVVHEDGIKYFIDNYGPAATGDSELFDVIVIDSLDPEDDVSFADELYTNSNFMKSLLSSLDDNGILVVQIGTAPSIHDPRADMSVYARRELLFNNLEAQEGVGAMLVYEEAHCGFNEPHSFLVVCKDAVACRQRWYAESDFIDFEIYERIVMTKSGAPALVHFDGSTQHTYRTPPRAWETVYCRREPTPVECSYRGLDLSKESFEFGLDDKESSFEIVDHENGETSVIALDDIPAGSYIMADHMASSFLVGDKSLANLQANTEVVGTGLVSVISDMLEFCDAHGHASLDQSKQVVEIGASFIMRETEDPAKANVGRWMPPLDKIPVYSPVYERHMMSFDVFLVATRDIAEGEEVMKPTNLWN